MILICRFQSEIDVSEEATRVQFRFLNNSSSPYTIESVQDFLIKLDKKPLMHLLEIYTFSLNNVIIRLTNIMNRADKNWAHF